MAIGTMIDRWSWILDAPPEAARHAVADPLAPWETAGLAVKACFFVALAETLMVSGSPRDFKTVFFAHLVAYGIFVFMMRSLARVVAPETLPPLRLWFSATSTALLPLFLLPPAALLCRIGGPGGLAAYELFKLALLSSILRRWSLGVQQLLRWPAWAAVLLTVSPLLIACLGALLALLFGGFAVLALAGAALS